MSNQDLEDDSLEFEVPWTVRNSSGYERKLRLAKELANDALFQPEASRLALNHE
jgi:hypothetical protein